VRSVLGTRTSVTASKHAVVQWALRAEWVTTAGAVPTKVTVPTILTSETAVLFADLTSVTWRTTLVRTVGSFGKQGGV